MAKTQFINELKHKVSIELASPVEEHKNFVSGVLDLVNSITISIQGEMSTSKHTLTLLEAVELQTLLTTFLTHKLVPCSST